MRREFRLVALLLLISQFVGCALFHELKPHRIRRINRGPAPSLDPEFTTMNEVAQPSALADVSRFDPIVVRAQQ